MANSILKEEKKPNGDDIWGRVFFNAKRFFESKGNGKTRSKIKDKWYKDFKHDFEEVANYYWNEGLKS